MKKRTPVKKATAPAVNWKRSYEQACKDFDDQKQAWMQQIDRLKREKHEQLSMLTQIRKLADRATGTDRSRGDGREPGAIGAVQKLIEKFTARGEALDLAAQTIAVKATVPDAMALPLPVADEQESEHEAE